MQLTAATCEAIMCGAITQAEAGRDMVYNCAQAGMVGAYPCTSPQCTEYGCPGAGDHPPPDISVSETGHVDYHPNPLAEQPRQVILDTPITPYNLVAPMPSITNNLPETGPESNPAGCGFTGWVNDNPLLAAGLVIGLALAIGKGK